MMAELLRKNPRILMLVLGVIIVGGLSSALVIRALEDPVLRKRVGVVSTPFPGADAARVESFVSSRLERRLQNVFEIKQVRSTSRQGISNLVVELHDDVNEVDAVWDRIAKSIDAAQVELPAGCLEPELEIFPLKAYVAIIAFQWRGWPSPSEALVRRIASQFADRVNDLPGTEQVDDCRPSAVCFFAIGNGGKDAFRSRPRSSVVDESLPVVVGCSVSISALCGFTFSVLTSVRLFGGNGRSFLAASLFPSTMVGNYCSFSSGSKRSQVQDGSVASSSITTSSMTRPTGIGVLKKGSLSW